VRFVYLASEINHYRFKELSMIDPSYPDIATASLDSKVETVVAKIVSSISTGKFFFFFGGGGANTNRMFNDYGCYFNVFGYYGIYLTL
jgi:hypothetical protein